MRKASAWLVGVSRLGDHHTSSQVLTEAKLIKKQSTEHKMGGGGYQALTMEYGKREIQGEGTVKKGGIAADAQGDKTTAREV